MSNKTLCHNQWESPQKGGQFKAAKKGKIIKEDKNAEIIKKLMEGFYDTEDLDREGGTKSFADDPVLNSFR